MIFLKPQPVHFEDLTPEAQEALFLEVKAFVESGGVLTADLWLRMEPAEKVVYRYFRDGGVQKEFDALNALAARIEGEMAPKGDGA